MLTAPGGPVRGQDENAGRARSEAHTRVAVGLTLPAPVPPREGWGAWDPALASFPGRGLLFLSGPWGWTGHSRSPGQRVSWMFKSRLGQFPAIWA